MPTFFATSFMTMPYRWFSFSRYLKERFGERVQKITIDAGFSCPNRDGAISTSGCIFCNNETFNPQCRNRRNGAPPESVSQQVEAGINRPRKKKVNRFMAYFQAYTNTYAPVDKLKELYDAALGDPRVAALAVGTRPDCIDPSILDLLASYTGTHEVWLELGLQSANDEVLKKINRGHTCEAFVNAVEMCSRYPVKLCVHVIIGLPGDTRLTNRETASLLSSLPCHGLKLHALQIVENTPLAGWYRSGAFQPIGEAEYVARAADFLERTPSGVVIQRLASDAPGDALIAPKWTENKQRLLNEINRELEKRNTRQGSLPVPSPPHSG